MTKMNTKKLVLCALFTALTYVATTFLRIPSPASGYLNLGDCFVILAGCFLGPVYGAFSAGVGSALSDYFGYPAYAPATLVIKALMAVTVYFLYSFLIKKTKSSVVVSIILSSIIAELIMVVGYFLYDWMIVGLPVAIADIVGNLAQGGAGIVSASLLISVIHSNRNLKSMFDFH